MKNSLSPQVFYGVIATVVLVIIFIFSVTFSNNTSSDITSFFTSEQTATIRVSSISRAMNEASANTSSSRIIHWMTNNYPRTATVDVHLLRKVQSSDGVTPTRYDLVETIAKDIPNTGAYTWVPTADHDSAASNLFVEVVCSNSISLPQGCSTIGSPLPLF